MQWKQVLLRVLDQVRHQSNDVVRVDYVVGEMDYTYQRKDIIIPYNYYHYYYYWYNY